MDLFFLFLFFLRAINKSLTCLGDVIAALGTWRVCLSSLSFCAWSDVAITSSIFIWQVLCFSFHLFFEIEMEHERGKKMNHHHHSTVLSTRGTGRPIKKIRENTCRALPFLYRIVLCMVLLACLLRWRRAKPVQPMETNTFPIATRSWPICCKTASVSIRSNEECKSWGS